MLGQAAPRLATRTLIARPTLDSAVMRQLTAALLGAALLETVLLRFFTRVGVHIPKDDAMRGVFRGASLLGSLAFNLASILAIALAVLLLASLAMRLEHPVGRAALAALSVVMLWGLGLSLATDAPVADALFGLSMALLVALVGLVLANREDAPPAGRVALALIVAAYLGYQYYTLGHLTYRLLDYTTVPPMSIAALRIGEGLVVAAGVVVFLGWGAGRWRKAGRAGLALVAGAVLAIGLAALLPVSTMSILALWTTGLSLFLPFPVYLLSLGLFLVTLVACWRSGDAFWTASGLSLLLLAGYMPEATYHHLLLLVGVACLSGAFRWAISSPAVADQSAPV